MINLIWIQRLHGQSFICSLPIPIPFPNFPLFGLLSVSTSAHSSFYEEISVYSSAFLQCPDLYPPRPPSSIGIYRSHFTTATYRPSAVPPLPLTFRHVHVLHFFRLGRRTFRLGQAIHKMVIHGSNDGCRRWSWDRSGSRRGSLERRQRSWHFDVLARNTPNFGKVHPDSRVTR